MRPAPGALKSLTYLRKKSSLPYSKTLIVCKSDNIVPDLTPCLRVQHQLFLIFLHQTLNCISDAKKWRTGSLNKAISNYSRQWQIEGSKRKNLSQIKSPMPSDCTFMQQGQQSSVPQKQVLFLLANIPFNLGS